MNRFLCVHGHFYQPPRENPWLESIERQESASPYHDWNERITAESYAPNGASRILDERGRIVRIVNNYERISFNYGPTLLAWLEANAADTYARIVEADASSQARFGGHGSALAQAYNHMILPLANDRDVHTQVSWGVADFRQRFGREPEGMWLPETAVDVRSLEALAAHGIRFTILEPGQARRVRLLGGGAWEDVSGGRIDPTRPYLQRLPSGREIVLFFYDGPISRGVAFERLLSNGERFAGRLLGAFRADQGRPQLVHIATDGETYGHHHRHGEMALAFALAQIERRPDVELTNYGEYLERHPPEHEVEIVEGTSWSCAHGVERWRSDCGCHTGGEAGWNQAWRAPLREALDWLRDALVPRYERFAGRLFTDPWGARDAYIHVILDRSAASLDRFFAGQQRSELGEAERVQALKLLELQRHAMLMFTSCGWFFNELSGIETVQVMQYAGRVVQLAHELFEVHVEEGFLERLARAQSNIPDEGSGRDVYDRRVRPAAVDLAKVAAHHAVLSLFEPPDERDHVYCYDVRVLDRSDQESGRAHMELSRVSVRSEITLESLEVSCAAVHFGDHNVYGGVRTFSGDEAYRKLMADVVAAFRKSDFPALVRGIDQAFGGATYSLGTLFRDEQYRILQLLLADQVVETEQVYERIYKNRTPLMRFIAGLGFPQPPVFRTTAELVLNGRLRTLLQRASVDARQVGEVLEEARMADVVLDAPGLGFAFTGTLDTLAERLEAAPQSAQLLERLEGLVELAGSLPFEVRLWQLQNAVYLLREEELPELGARAAAGDAAAAAWVERFRSVAEGVGVAVD